VLYATAPIGCITGLARPSVRLSVPNGLLTQKQKGTKKFRVNVSHDRSKRCANFQLKKSKVITVEARVLQLCADGRIMKIIHII